MNGNDLKHRIENLSIWKKGDQRAPHKPLLLLYALGRMQNGENRFIPYQEVKEKLTSLLIEYGPKRQSYHPEEPFVRLSNDGIWDLNSPAEINTKNPNNGYLLKNHVSGGFKEEVYELLKNDSSLLKGMAEIILNTHFPDTIHDDILSSVGLDLEFGGKKRRDPNFRNKVLKAYEYSCAVCGFHVRLGNNLVGIEAAHIKWHQAGGPDTETNGIALCAMHHKLFDRGVFTLNEEKVFLVADEAHGYNGFNEWLMNFHGKQIRKPIHPDYLPSENFLHWHVKEVFKGPYRYTVG